MKRILLYLMALAILAPAAVIGFDLAREPESTPLAAAGNHEAEIARGKYLVTAGNCQACHTARGGKPWAGGRAIDTAFGAIYTSNITSDAETGIGNWTADDFWRALHLGKSKDGSFLYPAFPYPNYTKVSRSDADAMFAYLKTLPAVRQPNRKHELRFPYDQRLLLAFWRALYFTPGEYRPDSAQSGEWNRGAYLVQGLGHCSACHSGRSFLGGTVAENDLAGGLLPKQDWYASSLAGNSLDGIADWQAQDIADLLKSGVSQRGSVFGPMAEVVAGSLQHLSTADINAIARYLKSIPAHADAERKPAKPAHSAAGSDADAVLKLGAKLYETHCVSCHQPDGKGIPPAYPPLAGNRSLSSGPSVNPVRIVLNGGFAPSTADNPRPFGMPPFSTLLSDAEVAAVVSYIRASWGNEGALVSPAEVGRVRGAPVE